MAVKNAVSNVSALLADFRASLAGTEYEGLSLIHIFHNRTSYQAHKRQFLSPLLHLFYTL